MNLGKLKFLMDRWLVYVSRTQFFMIAYLFVKTTDISWWWLVAGGMASIGFMYFDIRFILPRELEYMTAKNPEWNRIFGERKQ